MSKSLHCGRGVIADVLATRVHGRRPVSLIGFSVGARAIFAALQELADRRDALLAAKRGPAPLPVAMPVSVSATASAPSATPAATAAPQHPGSGGVASATAAAPPQGGAAPLAFDLKVDGITSPTAAAASAAAPADTEAPQLVAVLPSVPLTAPPVSAATASARAAEGPAAAAKAAATDESDEFDGVVQDVVLCGAPVTASADAWARIRPLVAGRIINVYSSRDWALRFLYRTAELQLTVAGLQAIPCAVGSRLAATGGVESVDATALISSHNQYLAKLPDILRLCNYRS
jgi:hypothetical protein